MEQSGGMQASLSGRYALALFELARDAGKLDAVGTDLRALREAVSGSDDLRRLLTSPLVKRDAATRAIEAVAADLRLDPLTARFLGVLAANRRLAQLTPIIRDFRQLSARFRGETSAEVTTAHPLDEGQTAALRARLKSIAGSEVAMEPRVDPAILGGLVVRIGSRQIDGSIRTKLNALATAMKG